MKRSNRLVLLVGVFLAVIAFVGVLLLSQGGGGGGGQPTEPTEATVVVAAEAIPLGTVIEGEMVTTKVVPIDAKAVDAYIDPSQVIGQVARQEVLPDQQITATITSGGTQGVTTNVDTPAGYRAMSVMVDQVSGVGTLIKTGDWVDMVIRMDIKPVVVDEEAQTATAIEAVDGDTSKLLLQGMQVLGTLLPPAAPPPEGGATAEPGTALTQRQQLVILALTPEQVEVVKWAQNDTQVSMSLVLRSPDDFVDAEGNRLTPESPCLTSRPATPPTPAGSPEPGASATPIPPFPCELTPGVVLDTLIARYGVLVVDIEGGVIGGSVPTTPAEPTEAPAESPAVSPAP